MLKLFYELNLLTELSALFSFAKGGGSRLGIARFFEMLDETLFTPDFGTYENLSYFSGNTSFKWIVLGLYFGILFAALVMFYNKQILGGFVRKLIDSGCDAQETALTLTGLSCNRNIFVRLSLSCGYTLRRVVRRVDGKSQNNATRTGGNSVSGRERTDFTTDRFYVPGELRDTALRKFDAKGSGWVSLIAVAVVGLAATIIIIKLMPFFVGMLDSALGGFSTEPDYLA